MTSVHFQGKPFNITVIQVYALTSNAEEAEVEWFYEDLQGLLELTPKKDALFIIGAWNAEVGSQETRGVRDKFGLGVQNEAGQRLIEFCQENALITEENFLISRSYSLELCIQMVYLSFSPLLFASLFSQQFVRPPQTVILLFACIFLGDGLDPCLLYNVMNLCP